MKTKMFPILNFEQLVAEKLLDIKAVKLQPTNPFTWASGWKSPIYCDNRNTLSYPAVRSLIKSAFVSLIREEYPDVEVIAGVATGAIGIGALVADELGLPFVYVRSAPKGHGLENLIEGELEVGKKVVVIEDLISTGGSSLKAVEAIRNADCEVLGMVAIFSYQFQKAIDTFKEANVELFTLSNYETLLEVAVSKKYVSKEDLETLQEWRKDAANWRNDLK